MRAKPLAALFAILCLAAATPDASAPIVSLEKALRSAPAKPDAARRKAVRAAVARAFDLDAVSRSVLGEEAARATPTQRARVSELILQRLSERVGRERIGADATLRVLRSRDVGLGETMITTEARRGQDNPVTVVWRVRQEAGGPKVVDVLREGISLSLKARRELAAAMRGHTLDQALAAMERAPAAE
ncbi:MAG: ABC transporter substrate-binding protein [Proteobacteria bacterium]|nr:ABC transporter substrate-binding protein [Pseudomonadota bacterium]